MRSNIIVPDSICNVQVIFMARLRCYCVRESVIVTNSVYDIMDTTQRWQEQNWVSLSIGVLWL